MRGDFSRIPADSGDYSAVLVQHDRVLVDTDWNSATGTSLSAHRALAADVIGPLGGELRLDSHLMRSRCCRTDSTTSYEIWRTDGNTGFDIGSSGPSPSWETSPSSCC